MCFATRKPETFEIRKNKINYKNNLSIFSFTTRSEPHSRHSTYLNLTYETIDRKKNSSNDKNQRPSLFRDTIFDNNFN